jgi:hypothetical protein
MRFAIDSKFICLKNTVVLCLLLLSQISAHAEPKSACESIHSEQFFAEHLQSRRGFPLNTQAMVDKYIQRVNQDLELQQVLPAELVGKLASRLENEYLLKQLGDALDIMSKDKRNWSAPTKFKAALKKALVNNVPASQIEERIKGLDSISEQSLKRALGHMTAEESAILLHGGNPLKPSKDSLIGQYLERTGAKASVQSFGRRPKRAGQNGGGAPIDPNSAHGPERLIVPVSNQSLAAFKELLARPEFMLHAHGANQGTLQVAFDGQVGSYARVDRPASEPRPAGFPAANNEVRISDGAIWPTIVLSTSEAGRARMYFDLATTARQAGNPQDPNRWQIEQQWPNVSKEPWKLEGFCATGGYASCTHWWGEAGIGDKRVKEWVFPGKVDDYASNSKYANPERDAEPRIQKLKKFQMPGGIPDHMNKIIDQMYSYPEAGEQLAVMVGTEKALVKGEWANPGFVAVTLLGSAKQERVPVVFVNVGDHTKKLPKDFEPQISAY